MRRHLRLRYPIRFALRLAPIVLLLSQTSILLQALKCQTSPQFAQMKYGDAGKKVELDFAGSGGFLYRMSSTMLYLEDDYESCRAIGMVPPAAGEWTNRKGSVALLWPLFQVLWLAHFVETMVTVLQGRPAAHETGMSIFEHSLAFAEAEGALSNTLGLFTFRFLHPSSQQTRESSRILLRHLNTTPENLLIALISTLNNLSSQILGVLDRQARYRLVNTGTWGLCYLSAFIWAFYNLSPEQGHNNMIMRFPIVCIVGFTPHLLIVIGILLCSIIYALALFLCFLSPPVEISPLSWRERFRWAFRNMQAHTHLTNFRVEMRQDFYTALLQAGLMALTAASEAVFLNERQPVKVAKTTWLEKQRLDAFEIQMENQSRRSSATDGRASGAQEAGQPWKSGYARQKVHKVTRAGPTDQQHGIDSDGGIGAFKRARRAISTYHLFSGILQLMSMWTKILVDRCLGKVGIRYRPRWLRLPKSHDTSNSNDSAEQESRDDRLNFWLLSDDGLLSLPESDDDDVESETERRLTLAHEHRQPPSEDQLSSHLYEWWKHGGWWGERDGSGSYAPTENEDEDATSTISLSTCASADEWTDEDDALSSGRRTPTQRHPHPHHKSDANLFNVDHALDPERLASLLDPPDASTRHEAKMLAYHLTSSNITTRSRYAHAQSFGNTKVLTSTRFRPQGSPTGPLSPDEETRLLEQMILSRRADAAKGAGDWRSGAEGMGQAGPSCVVCQNAPRTVLAWPCRCLSLCEECRVSLAMNNFGTCVCCRQEVGGFSRLFVP